MITSSRRRTTPGVGQTAQHRSIADKAIFFCDLALWLQLVGPEASSEVDARVAVATQDGSGAPLGAGSPTQRQPFWRRSLDGTPRAARQASIVPRAAAGDAVGFTAEDIGAPPAEDASFHDDDDYFLRDGEEGLFVVEPSPAQVCSWCQNRAASEDNAVHL